ncbi:MAG: hypothetical protein NTV22_07065, partial [bacterium]|nr:hypothetical protein [bacterium]
RHEEIAAPYLVNCAATACCALTTKTIISVASASSCLGAFVANLFAAALIPVVGGIHATLKTENCKL